MTGECQRARRRPPTIALLLLWPLPLPTVPSNQLPTAHSPAAFWPAKGGLWKERCGAGASTTPSYQTWRPRPRFEGQQRRRRRWALQGGRRTLCTRGGAPCPGQATPSNRPTWVLHLSKPQERIDTGRPCMPAAPSHATQTHASPPATCCPARLPASGPCSAPVDPSQFDAVVVSTVMLHPWVREQVEAWGLAFMRRVVW